MNTVEVSYSSKENVSQMIKGYNKRVTKTNKRSITPCNCSDKNNCPMNGSCMVENAVYKFVVCVTESQRNMFKLALLRAIGSRATTITPCHSETRKTKMT